MIILLLNFLLIPFQSLALDKQGKAHRLESGTYSFGSSLYNPTYAARPDNSGLALFRYAGHLDYDLMDKRLSVPLDLNFFTDKQTSQGLGIFVPTEADIIFGITSTWDLGSGEIEIGSRLEHDKPLDVTQFTQTYVDLRARYILGNTWFTLGWFAFNPTYAARPDNSGIALFRYNAHTELETWIETLFVGVDATVFTDQRSDSPLLPSELDSTVSLIWKAPSFELQVAWEDDRPIDRGTYTQDFLYFVMSFPFRI